MAIPTVVSARPSETSPSPTRHHSQQQCCPHCHQEILTETEKAIRIARFREICHRTIVKAVTAAIEQGGRR